MSKGIFHSELVRDTNAKGGVVLEVASEPKKSKFAGKPDYIFIKYNGEERALSAEHEDYFDALLLRKGDQIRVAATGSRESAKLEVLSENSNSDLSGGRESASPATDALKTQGKSGRVSANEPEPPAQTPSVKSTSSNGSAAPDLDALGVKFYAALGKADDLVSQFFPDAQRESWSAYEAADVVLRVAAGLSIELNRNGR